MVARAGIYCSVRIVRASRDEVTAEIEVGPAHLQAYGIVHGGVHAGIIESIASIGAALDAMPHGRSVVGLENHTSFLRAVRGGKLHAVAKPLARGRRSQVWEGSVYDDQGKLAAAEPYYRQAAADASRILGAGHRSALAAANQHAHVLREMGQRTAVP